MRQIRPLILDPGPVVVVGFGEGDDIGSCLDHDFQEVWCPIVGPSVVCLVRHMTLLLYNDGEWADYFTTDRDDLAGAIGMGTHAADGNNSPFTKALTRAVLYHFVRPTGGNGLAVRTTFHTLTYAQRSKLPDAAAGVHERLWLSMHAQAVG